MRAIAVASVALAAAACERIPGTDAHAIAQGRVHAAADLFDPAAAQFRNVTLRDIPLNKRSPEPGGATRVVCGEINGKNRNGAYVGFVRFAADPDNGERVIMEPTPSVTEEEANEAGERCTRQSGEPIYSEAERELRLSQCREASRMVGEVAAKLEFDAFYEAVCEAPQRS